MARSWAVQPAGKGQIMGQKDKPNLQPLIADGDIGTLKARTERVAKYQK